MLKTFTNLPILTFIPGSMRNRCVEALLVASTGLGEYSNREVSMFTALCIGCACLFVFGTAIRLGMLAGLLGRTGMLPEHWRRWMFDTKAPNSKR